jgi:hypothetical protein
MQLFGIRATSIGLGLGLVAAGLGVLGAGSSGPAATRYEVTAELLLASDGHVFACYAYLQSSQSDGCGGIEVRGVDFRQISVMEDFPSGGQGSPPLRLVGTWDGKALTLTESPQPAKKAPGLPEPCQQELGFDGGSAVMAREPEVWDGLKAHGIAVLQIMPCDDTTLGITVVVADERTVAWMTSHYQHIKIASWLRRLPSGP